MGQAFRRASGRIRSTSIDTAPPSQLKKAVDRTPPAEAPAAGSSAPPVSAINIEVKKLDCSGIVFMKSRHFNWYFLILFMQDDSPRANTENVLEERDSQYDAMLSQMVGRIQAKPGGKLEMGEAFVVEKSSRPMPKLRNTAPESGRYEEQPVPAGSLNVAQLRHIVLLHEGKADDHDGPMDIHQIAEKYQIDVEQVLRTLRFLSLPPEDSNNRKKDQP
ncbi:hypothetical protein RJ639_027456 [Escallonia herrerae]|uniref:Uncharacterized protein n=1 Tax=Escallonia herrerae TaxID=1293975 RepID=A0AA89BPB3_9ASTE|nr:hypothetical protein RJ639_027456 [Escallonia herrerae]